MNPYTQSGSWPYTYNPGYPGTMNWPAPPATQREDKKVMTWSVSLSGHCDNAEDEAAMIAKLRDAVASLDQAAGISTANVYSSYNGVVNLLDGNDAHARPADFDNSPPADITGYSTDEQNAQQPAGDVRGEGTTSDTPPTQVNTTSEEEAK